MCMYCVMGLIHSFMQTKDHTIYLIYDFLIDFIRKYGHMVIVYCIEIIGA